MDHCPLAEDGKESAKSEENNSIGSIGNDLWVEILSRLPLKPLMISKCVSKSWHQMASNIIIQSKPKNPISGFLVIEGETFNYLRIKTYDVDGDDEDDGDPNSLGLLQPPPGTEIIDSRDGFVLCSSWLPETGPWDYCLYNPITSQIDYLPTPLTGFRWSGDSVDVIATLVFDDSSRAYRVVRFASGFVTFDAHWNMVAGPDICVDIYFSETGQWAMPKEFHVSQCHFDNYSVLFDGSIYLLGSNSNCNSMVLRFDLDSESCELLSPPDSHSLPYLSKCLGVCDGRLCYAQHVQDDDGDCMNVWEFDNGKEWVLKNGIELELEYEEFGEARFDILAFHPYSTAVFVRGMDAFYWYDFRMGKMEGIISCSLLAPDEYMGHKVFPFSECFVHRMLDGKNGLALDT